MEIRGQRIIQYSFRPVYIGDIMAKKKQEDNTWLYVGIGTATVAAAGGLIYWLKGDKKKTPAYTPELYGDWIGAITDIDRQDRTAEVMNNIILPSSLTADRRVLHAKINGVSTAGIMLQIDHIYNAGYYLAVDNALTKIVTDKEGGHATRWYCHDFERCDIDAVIRYAPIPAAHSRAGAGLSDEEVSRHGTKQTVFLQVPVCTKHCHSDNTYAGQVNVKLVDDARPDNATSIRQQDGSALKFIYGEEHSSDCTNTNSTWYKYGNMCND
jgi:hypothetical protein